MYSYCGCGVQSVWFAQNWKMVL